MPPLIPQLLWPGFNISPSFLSGESVAWNPTASHSHLLQHLILSITSICRGVCLGKVNRKERGGGGESLLISYYNWRLYLLLCCCIPNDEQFRNWLSFGGWIEHFREPSQYLDHYRVVHPNGSSHLHTGSTLLHFSFALYSHSLSSEDTLHS